jgi:transposase-like protein
MTSTNGKAEVLKQDARGRVRVSAERREALLDEFERSGSSGAKCARLAGVKYATFANWVQKRRKQRVTVSTVVNGPARESDAVAKAGPVRLFEALVEAGRGCGINGRLNLTQ